jgi:hypothetical protein
VSAEIPEPEVESMSEVEVHQHKTGHSWVDLSVALSALVISLSSLFVAIQQGRTTEKTMTASFLPYVQIDTSNTDAQGNTGVISLTALNAGVGPARIDKVVVTYQGKPIRDAFELLRACCEVSGEQRPSIITSMLSHRMIGSQKDLDFLVMRRTDDGAQTFARFDQEREKLDIRACYCSVFDQCWIAALHASKSEAVKSCEALAGVEYKD